MAARIGGFINLGLRLVVAKGSIGVVPLWWLELGSGWFEMVWRWFDLGRREGSNEWGGSNWDGGSGSIAG